MKKILIINLRRLGDVYSTAHLINSISALGSVEISLLVYKESAKAANSLTNIAKTYSINRHEIITLKSNKLFSDADAFSALYNTMAEVKEQNWDEVINYSNDSVGTYLTSYLQHTTKAITGVHFDSQHLTTVNNNWSLLFNDILPSISLSPIHFIDCYHKMASTPYSFVGNKINSSSEHNEIARSQISNIRQSFEGDGKSAKIVGIQLKTSNILKDLPTELVKDFVFLMKKSTDLIPVLLIAPNEHERNCARIINDNFDNDLVVIESDLKTLPSVLLNLDLLVTPDTAVKHVANLTGTPVLEISLGTSPFLKQGPYSHDSLILTDAPHLRSFTNSGPTSISGMDIVSTVLYFFTSAKTIRPLLSNNVVLYGTNFDKMGIYYYPISGTIISQVEIARLMNRQLVSVLFQNIEIEHTYKDILNYSKLSISNWADKERINVTHVMRELLSTLKSLLQSKSRQDNSLDFVNSLGRLLNFCGSNELTQIPCLLFKAKLDLIRGTTVEENTKEVEILLHELKSNILKVLFLLKQLEDNSVSERASIPTNLTPEISL